MDDREEIFNRLIDEHLPMLRRVACRITGNAADSDEAIQLAMLSAWKKLDSFRGNAKLSSWIYRVTVNSCPGYREFLLRHSAGPATGDAKTSGLHGQSHRSGTGQLRHREAGSGHRPIAGALPGSDRTGSSQRHGRQKRCGTARLFAQYTQSEDSQSKTTAPA